MAQTINADDGVISGSTGLKFTADTTGILALQTASTTRVTVAASGNVGIGTTSPVSKLGITGTTVGSTPYITFTSSFATASYVGVATQTNDIVTGDTVGDLVIDSGKNILVTTNGNNLRLTIDTSGNVGIGVTPGGSYKLQINGSTLSTGYNVSSGGGVNSANTGTIDTNNAGVLRYYSRGANASTVGSHNWRLTSSDGSVDTSAMTLDTSGNVGIGAGPQYKLDVGPVSSSQSTTAGALGAIRNSAGADQSPFTQARIIVYGGTGVDTSNWGYFAYGSDASMRIVYGKTGAGNPLLFGTTDATNGTGTFTERMRISIAGVVTLTNLIYQSASTAVTAAGTTQGTATALTAQINQVTTVGASSGVILPTPAAAGLRIMVRNGSAATNLNVYPHSSGNIAGIGVNAAISVDFGVTLEFIAFDTTNWFIPSAVLG